MFGDERKESHVIGATVHGVGRTAHLDSESPEIGDVEELEEFGEEGGSAVSRKDQAHSVNGFQECGRLRDMAHGTPFQSCEAICEKKRKLFSQLVYYIIK